MVKDKKERLVSQRLSMRENMSVTLSTRTRVPERLGSHFKSFRTHWPSEQVRLKTLNRRLKKHLRKVETRKKRIELTFAKTSGTVAKDKEKEWPIET